MGWTARALLVSTADEGADMTWVPEACTLPTAEQPLRLAEFDDLFRRALRRVERVSGSRAVLTLTGGPAVFETAQDLAARETSCCSFFAFEVTRGASDVSVVVEVPPGRVDVLDALVARAEAALAASA
jgi:hypothetical protein